MSEREPFYYREQGSYCSVSSHEFAEEVAADIYDQTKDCLSGEMEIEIYTPTFETPLATQKAVSGGALVLHLTSEDNQTTCLIGIEFGRLDDQKQPVRSKLDAQAWKNNPDDPFSWDIYCGNFDETFRVISMLGIMLQLTSIRISYGAYT